MAAKPSTQLAEPLLRAARTGDVAAVRELLAAGAKPDQRPRGETTPLITAARCGHIEVVKALLDGGADPSFKHGGGKMGTTALLEAIRSDQFEIGCVLTAAGADVHYDWSGKGTNILYEAVDRCNSLCLQAHAPWPPNLMGVVYKGKGPAAKAAAEKQFPVCVKLVQKILEAGGRGQRRALLVGAAGSGNLPVVRLLLAHGSDVNEKDQYSETAFAYAVSQCKMETARELLKAGANPNLDTMLGPPFHRAVREEMTELVQAIIDSGADLNVRAKVTLKEPAQKTDSPKEEQPKYVLNLGADHVELAQACDSTPLIVAVRSGYLKIVQMLIKGGCDLEATDRDGFTALAWAIKSNRKEIAEVLRFAGAKEPSSLEGAPINVLFNACVSGDVVKARVAIANGADVNAGKESTRELVTPLMVAAREGHMPIVEELLKAGGKPNLGGREEWMMIVSPLMLAARHGHLEVVSKLLEAGAEAESSGRTLLHLREKGDSAIHEAARNGHAKVVELLLRAGVSATARSGWSDNVLSAAVESGDVETVRVVLAAGAKVNARNGSELLAIAMKAKNQDIVRELHAAGAVASGPQKGAKG